MVSPTANVGIVTGAISGLVVLDIDLRGDGGCVVAPSSIHDSGNTYTWVSEHEPGKLVLAELPGWLLRLVRGDISIPGYSLGHWRQLHREGVAEGIRNNTIASLSGHLLWHGVDPDVAIELLLGWNRICCSPPLDDDEVTHTVLSISRLRQRDSSRESLTTESGVKPT